MSDLPVTFSPPTARRVLHATRRVESMPVDLLGADNIDRIPRPPQQYPVEITGATQDGDNYRWVYTGRPQIRSTAGHGGRIDDPRFTADIQLYNTAEDANAPGAFTPAVPTGLVVDAWFERYHGESAVEVQWAFCVPTRPRGVPFLVLLTSDGGAAGTTTTAASWTYTATDEAGNQLGTELAPQQARSIGLTNAAASGSFGLLVYKADGTPLLLQAYGEYRGKHICPTGGG